MAIDHTIGVTQYADLRAGFRKLGSPYQEWISQYWEVQVDAQFDRKLGLEEKVYRLNFFVLEKLLNLIGIKDVTHMKMNDNHSGYVIRIGSDDPLSESNKRLAELSIILAERNTDQLIRYLDEHVIKNVDLSKETAEVMGLVKAVKEEKMAEGEMKKEEKKAVAGHDLRVARKSEPIDKVKEWKEKRKAVDEHIEKALGKADLASLWKQPNHDKESEKRLEKDKDKIFSPIKGPNK